MANLERLDLSSKKLVFPSVYFWRSKESGYVKIELELDQTNTFSFVKYAFEFGGCKFRKEPAHQNRSGIIYLFQSSQESVSK
jgi:hypothetical protein